MFDISCNSVCRNYIRSLTQCIKTLCCTLMCKHQTQLHLHRGKIKIQIGSKRASKGRCLWCWRWNSGSYAALRMLLSKMPSINHSNDVSFEPFHAAYSGTWYIDKNLMQIATKFVEIEAILRNTISATPLSYDLIIGAPGRNFCVDFVSAFSWPWKQTLTEIPPFMCYHVTLTHSAKHIWCLV